MVDTGSFYTLLPPELVDSLGTICTADTRIVTADNRTLQVPLGVAYLRHRDREGGIILGKLDVPKPLLGASALEVLGFKVNPVDETLEYARPFGPPLV